MAETATTLEITGGPDKPALQFALAYPEKQDVHFKLAGDALDARILHMDEQGQSFDFRIEGEVISGVYKGRRFTGTYSVEQRAGQLTLT